jgi:tripartite-type tricarboxylate transporter receptor subunit TctC
MGSSRRLVRLNKELKQVLALDEVKKLFLNEGLALNYLGPTEFGPFIEKEIIRWASVVKKANIKYEE